jgi:hypothetical protein
MGHIPSGIGSHRRKHCCVSEAWACESPTSPLRSVQHLVRLQVGRSTPKAHSAWLLRGRCPSRCPSSPCGICRTSWRSRAPLWEEEVSEDGKHHNKNENNDETTTLTRTKLSIERLMIRKSGDQKKVGSTNRTTQRIISRTDKRQSKTQTACKRTPAFRTTRFANLGKSRTINPGGSTIGQACRFVAFNQCFLSGLLSVSTVCGSEAAVEAGWKERT